MFLRMLRDPDSEGSIQKDDATQEKPFFNPETGTFHFRADGADRTLTLEEMQKIAPKAYSFDEAARERAEYRKRIEELEPEASFKAKQAELFRKLKTSDPDEVESTLRELGELWTGAGYDVPPENLEQAAQGYRANLEQEQARETRTPVASLSPEDAATLRQVKAFFAEAQNTGIDPLRALETSDTMFKSTEDEKNKSYVNRVLKSHPVLGRLLSRPGSEAIQQDVWNRVNGRRAGGSDLTERLVNEAAQEVVSLLQVAAGPSQPTSSEERHLQPGLSAGVPSVSASTLHPPKKPKETPENLDQEGFQKWVQEMAAYHEANPESEL